MARANRPGPWLPGTPASGPSRSGPPLAHQVLCLTASRTPWWPCGRVQERGRRPQAGHSAAARVCPVTCFLTFQMKTGQTSWSG